MRLCTSFELAQPQISPGPYLAYDSGVLVAAISDSRLAGGSEIRRINPYGQGAYTDNHRTLSVGLVPATKVVEITTWLGCELELWDPTGTLVYATSLPSSVERERFEPPGQESIAWLKFTAIGEFMLLQLCAEG